MLSIIIPTLNEQEHLPKLLESIRQQDYSDYEIIVADAGSKDKTLEIATSYRSMVVPGGLPAVGRNNGAKVARGEVLLFLDADVVLPPHFLKNSLEEFEARNLGVAGFLITPLDGKSVDVWLYRFFNILLGIGGGLFHWAAMAIMASHTMHKAVGGFDESITFGEDISYVLAVAKISRYGYIRQPFFTSIRRYRVDGRITYIKYVFGFFYIFFWGPVRSNIFNYRFDHYKNKNAELSSKK